MTKSVMKSTASNICFRIIISLLLLSGGSASAQILRPVTSAWTLEVGGASEANTYLTPLRYSGWTAGLGLERWQAMRFNPERWVMRLDVRGDLTRTLSPAKNSVMWGMDVTGAWAMMWRARNLFCSGFTCGVGPLAELELGVLYLPRNGNNPAQARAAFTFGATAYASYSFSVGKLPVVLRYQPSLSLLGAFFCPDYGELYYEIYLGNHSGLAHFAWPGSYRRFMSVLTADLRFGATALRLGYRAGVVSSKANDIVNRSVTNSFSIGVSGEWMMLRPSANKLSHDAQVISAYY